MTGGELIPASAWVQAVFLCLFIVFAVYFLSWQRKFNKENQDFQRSLAKEAQNHADAESTKWQTFIEASNDKWRMFNKEQRVENNTAMDSVHNSIAEVNSSLTDVNKSLSNLTQVTGSLVQTMGEMRKDIYQHDEQAKEIKALVEQNGKPAPKPRAKKAANVPPAE